MDKVLIHHNFKRNSLIVKEKLIDVLERRGIEITNNEPNLIISLGGDGTMLNAIRRHHQRKVPFIGINTGSLGFLPTVDSDKIEQMLDNLIADNYHLDKYPLFKIDAHTTKGEEVTGYAFNEMILKQATPRLLRAQIFVNDCLFNDFAGDGIIVSTAFGSTGYAIWAGGAAVHPALGGIQLIPICPNDNAIHRPLKTPIILPNDSKITIKVERPKKSAVIVGVDGVKLSKYAIADVNLFLKENVVEIVRFDDFDYLGLYQRKIIKKNYSG